MLLKTYDNGSLKCAVPSSQGSAEAPLHLPADGGWGWFVHREIFWIFDWNAYFSPALAVTHKTFQD